MLHMDFVLTHLHMSGKEKENSDVFFGFIHVNYINIFHSYCFIQATGYCS